MGRLSAIGGAALCLLLIGARATPAINIQLDYTYDSNGFFAPGSAARETLEQVATFYSNILDDTFSPIVTPPPLTSSLPSQHNPGTAFWQWTMTISNPSGPGNISLIDQPIAANEYRLYVGAQSLSGNTLGHGGPGGYGYNADNDGGNFTFEEINELEATTEQFISAVTQRGESGGFAGWGGSVSFDLDAATVWHFDHNTPPAAGANDFLSVAVHEIGHALGLGSSTVWNNLTTGSGDAAYFTGTAASALFGGPVPLAFVEVEGGAPIADKGHFREETMSTIFGASTPQEAAMAPTITVGTRKRLTRLDAAALTDLGWTVVAPNLPGDFNNDHVVDAADYTVWRDGLGGPYTPSDYADWRAHFGQSSASGAGAASAAVPEPAAATLAFAAFFLALAPARRRISGSISRGRLS